MTRYPRVWMMLLPLLSLVACGGHDHGHEEPNHASEAPSDDYASHHAPAAVPTGHDLVLDGDQKWAMDDHTRFVVGTMSDRFVGRDLETSSAEDLRKLGTQLREDINELIKGCTMQGDAHNELHKFLGHYIPAVDKMASSGEPARAERVHELLVIYAGHFE